MNALFKIFLIFMFSPLVMFSQNIIEKPILFNDLRKELSLQYMESRYGIKKDAPTIDPKLIVVHWTAIPSLQESFNTLYEPTLPGNRKDIQEASPLNVSAHYLIDRNGQIYRLLPDTVFARHVIGLNLSAIGIENVGGTSQPLTKAQLAANVELIKCLAEKYDIKYLIGHHEYTKFKGHPLWMEKDATYLTQKNDPGPEFMNKLRNELKDTGISGPPQAIE
ncbi:peptidoglycan recognition family protein [soil metagenome]